MVIVYGDAKCTYYSLLYIQCVPQINALVVKKGKAIEDEDYGACARLRDEINARQKALTDSQVCLALDPAFGSK